MSPQRFRRSHDLLSPLVYPPDGPIRPDEARFDAWARALGQGSRYPVPQREPCRADLPDVDLSRVVIVPRGPGLWLRAWRAIFPRRNPVSAPSDGGSSASSVGDPDGTPHMMDGRAVPFSPKTDRVMGSDDLRRRAA